jgi:hypothetical protein
VAPAGIKGPLNIDRFENLIAHFAVLQWSPRLLLFVGHLNITRTLRRSVSVLSMLGSDLQYRIDDFARSHNTCSRRLSCVGLQIARRTELSTRRAHLLMLSFLLSQSIVQNLEGWAESSTGR